ncbi:MAG: hypothetical protein IT446_01305 [Phycisphaerales bacterium]|nr:hypothetical protein [Phycisphaerales bacterium]
MRWFWIVMGLLGVFGATSAAQSTRPARMTWESAVEQFTRDVLDGELVGVRANLDEKTIIRQFGAQETCDLVLLMDRIREASLLGQHAYDDLPATMAGDIAADFRSAGNVPDDFRQYMNPQDEQQMQQANQIARQWVGDVLSAAEQEPVGIIVCWQGGTHDAELGATRPQPLFVLVKGRRNVDGEYRIAQIVFGNPLSSGKP